MPNINLQSTQSSGFLKSDFDEIKAALQDSQRTINIEALKVGNNEIIDSAGTLDPINLRNTNITSTELEILRNGSDASLLHNHGTTYASVAVLNSHISDANIHFTKSSILLNDLGDVLVPSPSNGQVLTFNGSSWVPLTPATGDITGVTAISPLTGGGTSGDVSLGIQQASNIQDGYLSSTDWTTFNNKADSSTMNNHINDTTIHFTKNDIQLNDLWDVNISAPASGQALIHNGSEWVGNEDIVLANEDNTISGKWNFTTSPTIPYPSIGMDATNKDYVDAFAQGVRYVDPVLSKENSSPPLEPITGDRYIIATSPTDAWVNNYNDIAEWNESSSWVYTTATSGLATFVIDESALYVYSDVVTSWVKFSSLEQHNNLGGLQGGQPNEYYHLTSNEYENKVLKNQNTIISGVFSYQTSPVVPYPSTEYHVVNKNYVDSHLLFTGLSDTPNTYTGEGEKVLKVNTTETGIYFSQDNGTLAMNELIAHTSRPEIHFLTSEIKLIDLADTNIISPSQNDALIYDEIQEKWVARSVKPSIFSETITSWDEDSGIYYKDITHDFGTKDVFIYLYDNDTKEEIGVHTIKKLNLNTIRIYITNNTIQPRVLIIYIENSSKYIKTISTWDNIGYKQYFNNLHHGLNEEAIMVQAYDTTTDEVISVDVERVNDDIITIYSSDDAIKRILLLDVDAIDSYITSILPTDLTNAGSGRYYYDIEHELGSNDIATQLYADGRNIGVDEVTRINVNTLRLYTTNDEQNMRILAFV